MRASDLLFVSVAALLSLLKPTINIVDDNAVAPNDRGSRDC